MPPIRFIVQSNPGDADKRLPALARYAEESRREPGCIQFEDFRSMAEPQDLLHLELWQSAEAWDAHWFKLLQSDKQGAVAPFLELIENADPSLTGVEAAPREFGANGIELYEQRFYAHSDGVWFPAVDSGPQSVRWPAWAPVRIVVQMTSDPSSAPTRSIASAHRRKEYPGCNEFDHFRGTEFTENTVLMELWSTPKIYDDFWHYLQTESMTNPIPGSRPIPAARRYGIAGNEWHNHLYYTLVDGIWEPRDPALRSTVVRW
jgi:quinol monooxygenase YgiN